jgi:hypothetical protein
MLRSYLYSVCRTTLHTLEVAYLDPGIVNEPYVAELDRHALETL